MPIKVILLNIHNFWKLSSVLILLSLDMPSASCVGSFLREAFLLPSSYL